MAFNEFRKLHRVNASERRRLAVRKRASTATGGLAGSGGLDAGGIWLIGQKASFWLYFDKIVYSEVKNCL